MAQIGFVNAVNELCNNETTTFQNDSFIPVFRKNGNENIVEKFLAKNLPSGGSSDYAMPKNVIVINPDAVEVEGKVYNSFAHAKSYMELNPYEKFCVELSAGEFDEQITLDLQWEIHGNNTIITQPIDTNIIEDGVEKSDELVGIYVNAKSIKNCTITKGFVSYPYSLAVPIYMVYDCVINQIATDDSSQSELTMNIIIMNNCVIDMRNASQSSKETSIASYIMLSSCVSHNMFLSEDQMAIFCNSTISGEIESNGNIIFDNCAISHVGLDGQVNIGGSGKLKFYNCYIMNAQIDFTYSDGKGDAQFENCKAVILKFIGSSSGKDEAYFVNCSINNLDESETNRMGLYKFYNTIASIQSNVYEVNAHLNSAIDVKTYDINTAYTDVSSTITTSGNITTDHRVSSIMYADDESGKNMSIYSTDKTYYGIYKNGYNDDNTLFSPSNYIWFPNTQNNNIYIQYAEDSSGTNMNYIDGVGKTYIGVISQIGLDPTNRNNYKWISREIPKS